MGLLELFIRWFFLSLTFRQEHLCYGGKLACPQNFKHKRLKDFGIVMIH